jgi:formate hydrogenlyase subunit 3/multisubunit Na+/H+ antiporter MnhD subunit
MLLMVLGTLAALSQRDLKRLLIAAFLAQVGLIVASVGYGVADVSHTILLAIIFLVIDFLGMQRFFLPDRGVRKIVNW